MLRMMRCRALLLGLVFCQLLCSSAFSQDPKGKLITIVVPFTPGSAPDATARTIIDALSEELNQPIIVVNRIGASGNIGTMSVARAAPDGTTLLLTGNTIVINASLFKNLEYDPIKNFTPVALVARGRLALAVSATLSANTLAELTKLLKSNPGKINYASPGNGTPHHLAMELLQISTGTRMTHVPYSGLAQAVTDLIGAHVDAMFVGLSTIVPLANSSKVKIIGISSLQRAQTAPDIPTLAEQGLPGFEVEVWFGLLAPAGTPSEVVQRLDLALNRVLQRPAVVKRFEAQGLEIIGGTPDRLDQLLKSDQAKWTKVIKESGLSE